MRRKLPNKRIREAILSGHVPKIRPMSEIIRVAEEGGDLTLGEQVCAFSALFLVVPTGMMQGKPLIPDENQQVFIQAIFDPEIRPKEGILSMAARNGKSLIIAVILLAYLIGPLAEQNITVASAAMSREQAGLVFELMYKTLLESPMVEGLWDAVPSSKRIVGLRKNTTYLALSADAKKGFGRDLKVILLDESGQIVGPRTDFTDMLESRQGSHDDGLFLTVSTQGRSDADYLSLAIDRATREPSDEIVCHLYVAHEDADLLDEAAWAAANPGLGKYRSVSDLRKQMKDADALPAKEPKARNQYLNQRIAMEQLAIPPKVWKRCAGDVDLELFRNSFVAMGLDLSKRNDLVAAVLSAEDDDGIVHLLPFVFCPTSGIEERARRDRAPYDVWVKQGYMLPIGGETMDLDQIAEALRDELHELNITVNEIHYDKTYYEFFWRACERVGAFKESDWIGVPQSFREMGARLSSMLGIMAEGCLRHGSHPVLNMAATNAVGQVGREGVVALAKHLSTQRIDPLVAAVMATWPFGDGLDADDDSDLLEFISNPLVL